MNAVASPILAIFEKKLHLEVPLFQRQYVWSREQQWEPLWEDLSRKFGEHLDGRRDGPIHFLGAMVLDQKQTPTTHVEKRQVIDGQQRLTTLQIFLAAFRDFCRQNQAEELADECESFTLNKGMMATPAVDKFKVWPTQLDREQFEDVMALGSHAAVIAKHPLRRRPYARKPDARPRMVEAYLFFYSQLESFFIGVGDDIPIASESCLAERLEISFTALRNALHVVVIDLDGEDDAQVIFETLNARGEPLLPADLLRNYIFLRAGRSGENREELYHQYWQRFDDHFWRQEVRQGRLSRPRSDLFMQHFLASRQTIDIPVKHLFAEYKYWIERSRPFASVREELEVLARQRDDFRRIAEPRPNDVVYRLAVFIERFDMSTVYPLLLHLMNAHLADASFSAISTSLESYLVRRAVCGFTTKGYNKTFLSLTRSLRKEGTSPAALRTALSSLRGESSQWPSDELFTEYWHKQHVYSVMQNPKIVHILSRINDSYLGSLSEHITINTPLTVEHILPQSWISQWPLADGSRGVTMLESRDLDATDARLVATRHRNAALQTFGNLTVIPQALNSSVSNGAWEAKKDALTRMSLLPINQQLYRTDTWDEHAIKERSNELLSRALTIWPSPE